MFKNFFVMEQIKMNVEKLEVLAMLYRYRQLVRYLDLVKRGELLLAAALDLTEDNLVSRIKLNLEANHEPESYYELHKKAGSMLIIL